MMKSAWKPPLELPEKNKDMGGVAPKSGVISESIEPEKKNLSPDSTLLDRLLLAHSNLSSLLPKVDEVVAQAFNHSTMTEQQTGEIESFVDVIYEIVSLLKPWVPRLQKVLSCAASESEDHGGKTLTEKAFSFTNEEASIEAESPEETKLESLISPSPFVSWRADCKLDRGKQMFLLTPLSMSKTLSYRTCKLGTRETKVLGSSPKWSFSPPKSCLLPVPPYDDKTKEEGRNVSMSDVGEVFAEASLGQPPPIKPYEPMVTARQQEEFRSWAVNSPKTCSSKNCSGITESTEGESSGDLTFKYPELRGIQSSYRPGIGKKELESSPEWLFSPPKTCVLLVPPNDDNSSDNIKVDKILLVNSLKDQESDVPMLKEDPRRHSCAKENARNSLAGNGFTPMWKAAESSVQRRKRPGESTLKKELWTRFEEASTGGVKYDTCACQGTARKGFLDMLDEVSSDEQSPVST